MKFQEFKVIVTSDALKIFSLPNPISKIPTKKITCIVQVNLTAIFLIGGQQNGIWNNRTW